MGCVSIYSVKSYIYQLYYIARHDPVFFILYRESKKEKFILYYHTRDLQGHFGNI